MKGKNEGALPMNSYHIRKLCTENATLINFFTSFSLSPPPSLFLVRVFSPALRFSNQGRLVFHFL
jgi:hypothetical protein